MLQTWRLVAGEGGPLGDLIYQGDGHGRGDAVRVALSSPKRGPRPGSAVHQDPRIANENGSWSVRAEEGKTSVDTGAQLKGAVPRA